ncbi:potassium/proton antiporter [Kaistia dalseonensis]|uniref:Cell volume regulation protein A n=1 Tax=Kaistia dalseonensis TaxID=410840 RepID=A0ABU0H181_9HYPH|nr:potassium/proton antiporter [Kaistia dalseonensis]MCX5493509.1 potassium/proton antiporter [Kaistia dalseonensis]MDQ0436069.1 cell volume regulation protein A [Kaistia dalseonensis]
MIESMNLAILVGSLLIAVAVFTSLFSTRFGAPLLLVFLILGLIAGEDGLGIRFDNGRVAYFIGSIALAIILFESGFETKLSSFRTAALPALTLATAGVLITAGIVGLSAWLFFRWTWVQSFLLGTIVASTDAAAVFFLLRVGGISLRDRVRSSLEVESGSNDPMAIFLTIALVGVASAASVSAESEAVLSLVRSFFIQIGLGTIFGLVGGYVIVRIVNRVELEPALYPIVVLAMALALFAATGMLQASGFLAVYVAGLICGNAHLKQILALRRFLQGMSWLAQIAMFLTLGLLATPTAFGDVLVPALLTAFVLIFLARPIAVWLCLAPFGFSRNETAFVAWVGLRGAVSILLAILPMIGGVPHGQAMFNVAFIVVLCSLVLQGWTIGPVARWLRLVVPARYGPVDRIELELPGKGDHEVVAYRVGAESAVGRGRRIPRWARPSLILRHGRSLRYETAGPLEIGDQVYIVTATENVRLLDQLFARPAESADDSALFGDFVLAPNARMADLAAVYGFVLPREAETQTAAGLLKSALDGNIEEGDRVACGPVDLIVRRLNDDDEVAEVGLALERREGPRKLPLFQNRREIMEYLRERRIRKTAARAAALAAAVTTLPVEDEGEGQKGR